MKFLILIFLISSSTLAGEKTCRQAFEEAQILKFKEKSLSNELISEAKNVSLAITYLLEKMDQSVNTDFAVTSAKDLREMIEDTEIILIRSRYYTEHIWELDSFTAKWVQQSIHELKVFLKSSNFLEKAQDRLAILEAQAQRVVISKPLDSKIRSIHIELLRQPLHWGELTDLISSLNTALVEINANYKEKKENTDFGLVPEAIDQLSKILSSGSFTRYKASLNENEKASLEREIIRFKFLTRIFKNQSAFEVVH